MLGLPQFITMVRRCLLSVDDRIKLWRNTLQLFYESVKPPFVGPLKKAGFSKVVIDRKFIKLDSGMVSPDIVSSAEDGWAVLELTTRPISKEPKLSSYVSIDPRYLSNYGLRTHTNTPDVISSRLDSTIDGPYCQLILRDSLKFQNESCIKNPKLRKALVEANGLDLRKLPNISIVLVPEMASRSKELRRGIFEIVMQLFDIKCDGKTAEQIVKEGLDKIENSISQKDKNNLEKRIKIQMDVLVKEYLQDHLEFDEATGVYRTKNKTYLHPNTKGLIVKKMKEWASGDRDLYEFSEDDPVQN